MVYDEGEIRQRHDQLYMSALSRKKKLNHHDQSDKVWSMTKSRLDNDVTDHTGVVYVEIGIELS